MWQQLSRSVLAFWLTLGAATFARGESPGADDLDVPADAILLRKGDVFLTHGGGIFRADLRTKEWQKLQLPAEMPTGGRFGSVPADSQLILYYTTTRDALQEGQNRGLYASADAGQSWRLVTQNDGIGPVTLLQSGALFAVTNAGRLNGKAFIEVSHDLGKTWRDITGNSFGSIVGLFPDPDHPGLICLDVNSIRGYILQADDETYAWTATRMWDWHSDRREPVSFLRTYSTTAINNPLYTLPATLRNYFEYEFGSRASIAAIDLSADGGQFSFRVGDDVAVPITVRFLEDLRIRRWYWQEDRERGRNRPEPTPIVEQLLDHPTDLGQWGLRVEFEGKREYRSAAISAAVRRIRDQDFADRIKGLAGRAEEKTRELIDQLHADPGWKASELVPPWHTAGCST